MTEEKKMNLLPFAITGMVPTLGSGKGAKGGGGGGGGDGPRDEEVIVIGVDAANTPKAVPNEGWVSPGGTITWQSDKPFEIILKLLWATNDRVSRKSGKVGDKHELKVTASKINGRYPYGIRVGDQEVDPDVIIGPKSNQ
jgi:hypothetical protein